MQLSFPRWTRPNPVLSKIACFGLRTSQPLLNVIVTMQGTSRRPQSREIDQNWRQAYSALDTALLLRSEMGDLPEFCFPPQNMQSANQHFKNSPKRHELPIIQRFGTTSFENTDMQWKTFSTKSHEIPRNKQGKPRVGKGASTKKRGKNRRPTKTPRNPTKSHEIPRNPTKFHKIPRNSTKSHEIPRTHRVFL